LKALRGLRSSLQNNSREFLRADNAHNLPDGGEDRDSIGLVGSRDRSSRFGEQVQHGPVPLGQGMSLTGCATHSLAFELAGA
jgi:hypothetical protein